MKIRTSQMKIQRKKSMKVPNKVSVILGDSLSSQHPYRQYTQSTAKQRSSPELWCAEISWDSIMYVRLIKLLAT